MTRFRTTDLLAVILLVAGAVAVPVAGWAAGVVLLWASPTWSRREKLVGTAVVPGGLGAPLLFLALAMSAGPCTRLADTRGRLLAETCSPAGSRLPLWAGVAVLVALILAPLGSGAFLVWRAGAAPGSRRRPGRQPYIPPSTTNS
jgi:hypothetical protein